MDRKRDIPPDGELLPLKASSDNFSNNIVIIKVPDEMKKPGDTTYQLATLDRNKEGIEWPGDEYLDKLIPGLPKVNVPKENEPELKKLPGASKRPCVRRRKNNKFDRKVTNSIEAHRPSLPKQKYRSEVQQECTQRTTTIEPWVQNPWETTPFNPRINAVLPLNTPVAPNSVSFDNFYAPPPAYSGPPNDLYPAPDNVSYDNIRPRGSSSTQYIKKDKGNQRRPLINRIPDGPRMPVPPNSGLLGDGPALNTNLYGEVPVHGVGSFTVTPTSSAGLYGDGSGSWYNDKPSLLGEFPITNRPPFTRNFTKYPTKNKAYVYTSTTNSKGKLSNQDKFSSNARGGSTLTDPYDSNFNRVIGPGLTNDCYSADKYQNHLNGTNETYEHARNVNNSVDPDLNDINYSRFQGHCPSSVPPYEETYVKKSVDNSYESNYIENNPSTNSLYHNQSNLPPVNFSEPIAVHNNTTAEFHNSETPRMNFNAARRPNNREHVHNRGERAQMQRPWNTNKNRKRVFNQFNNKRRFTRGKPNFPRWRSSQQ